MRTSPESAPCASDASTPASAYAPRSATRPFKPMQATQSERTEHDAVRGGGPVMTDAKQRRGRQRRRERGDRTGGERRAQLTVEAALPQPDELEHGRPADDRQPGAPRQPRRRLPVEPERPRSRERRPVA